MGLTQKRFVLGQVATAATTETLLYSTENSTAFSVTEAIIESILVCNRGGSATTFRIALVPDGKADLVVNATGNKHYLYYDVNVPANDTFMTDPQINLSDDDDLRVYPGNGNPPFTAVGSEMHGMV